MITKFEDKLLNERGFLKHPGFQKYPIWQYDRNEISASIWRIKEWDYYAVLNEEYGLSFTVSDLGYSALISVVFFDFITKKIQVKSKILWFPFGKMKLPNSSEMGDIHVNVPGFKIDILRKELKRNIEISVEDFIDSNHLHATFEVDSPYEDSMVIATPWDENPKAFYYNQKVNCMPTNGEVVIGEKCYSFKSDHTYTVLDWGRGVWTYKNTWYWGSMSVNLDGIRFGFNIGYGFGNTSNGTENVIFYNGQVHKLDQVVFHLDDNDYLSTWKFTSNDGRFEMTMEPILDRQDNINYGIIKNFGHQVFGLFSGKVILDDGQVLIIKNKIGFAEKITNHY